MSVKRIDIKDLLNYEGKEGLILQGCGGDPQEWIDGINELFTKQEILLDDTKFNAENCAVFDNNGSTCILYPFSEDVNLNATYKSPNYFILQGERVICDNFSNMLRLVIDRLYLYDKSVIDDMCANKRKLFTGSQLPFFSYDATEIKYPDQVANSGIYHSTGFSAATIMWIIQALLDKHEIERSEFVYSARSTKPAAKEETK